MKKCIISSFFVFYMSMCFADTGNLPVKFSVAQPVSLNVLQDFVLGLVTPHPLYKNEIEFSPDGFVSSSRADVPVPVGFTPGIVSVSGKPNSEVTVSLNNSSIYLTDSLSGNQVEIKDFKILHSGMLYDVGKQNVKVILGTNGTDTISFGTKLILNPAQTAGNYTGNIIVTVDY